MPLNMNFCEPGVEQSKANLILKARTESEPSGERQCVFSFIYQRFPPVFKWDTLKYRGLHTEKKVALRREELHYAVEWCGIRPVQKVKTGLN